MYNNTVARQPDSPKSLPTVENHLLSLNRSSVTQDRDIKEIFRRLDLIERYLGIQTAIPMEAMEIKPLDFVR
jgi:hypothetical protein